MKTGTNTTRSTYEIKENTHKTKSKWATRTPPPEGITSKVLRSSYWICWQIWCVHLYRCTWSLLPFFGGVRVAHLLLVLCVLLYNEPSKWKMNSKSTVGAYVVTKWK
jgi:hypothetical protein